MLEEAVSTRGVDKAPKNKLISILKKRERKTNKMQLFES
jgi:hypothetical protein